MMGVGGESERGCVVTDITPYAYLPTTQRVARHAGL